MSSCVIALGKSWMAIVFMVCLSTFFFFWPEQKGH